MNIENDIHQDESLKETPDDNTETSAAENAEVDADNEQQSSEMTSQPSETNDEEASSQEEIIDEKKKQDLEELKNVIKENAREDEQPASRYFTLAKILGGDILSAHLVRRQILLILIIVMFTIVYVTKRYSCQQKQIDIARLKQQLVNSRYKALSISSELTELSRESNVLEQLKNNNDTTLKISQQPPYIINIGNE